MSRDDGMQANPNQNSSTSQGASSSFSADVPKVRMGATLETSLVLFHESVYFWIYCNFYDIIHLFYI